MSIIDELTEQFRRFPGVGPRQAGRFVFYLLKQDKSVLQKLGQQIPDLANQVKTCEDCRRFFISVNADIRCQVCRDPNRDHEKLVIVATDSDLDQIEKSGSFDGVYFVLGGNAPVVAPEPEKIIRLRRLKSFITNQENSGKHIKEVILALSANPEGEHTADLVKDQIRDVATKHDIEISMLGRGLSTGTEIEYSDPKTIQNAMKNRFVQ